MKVFSQLEKAQLENTTSDTGSLPKGMITYRTDLNIAKISNGTAMLALIDESSAQTLSNKTYASPSITGFSNWAQTTTPATPSAGNNRMYFKADGKLYTLDSAGNEAQVGSGAGGGVKNLITNGSADDTAASIFVPYADAAGTRPVDGTGGSPTVTTSVTTTAPLDGTKAFLLTKPASNVQGQGWAVPFTVDPAYRAKSLKISADYIINSGTFVPGNNSGTPADGDLIWYIYDVTNSQLIEPSNIKMFSNNSSIADKFEATFQTSVSGSSYRLIAHVASTSALAFEIKLDNITVSPQVYVFGTPVTDWQAYTPASTQGFGSVTNQEIMWRRVGDSIEVKAKFTVGSLQASEVRFSLPPGFVSADTTKIPTIQKAGAWVQDSAGSVGGQVLIEPGVSYFTFGAQSGSSGGLLKQTTAIGNYNAGKVSFVAMCPIQGLSSSVQMSDAADTRIVAAKVIGAVASTGAGVVLNAGEDYDTHGTMLASRYTIPVGGWYSIKGNVRQSSSANVTFYAYVDGSLTEELIAIGSADQLTHSYATTRFCTQGQIIDIRPNNTVTLSQFTFAIERVSGPQAIAASEKINAIYKTSSGQVLGAGVVIVDFGTKEEDSHGLVTTGGSWKFTAQTSKLYKVSGALRADGAQRRFDLYKNGAFYRSLFEPSAVSELESFNTTLRLNAGDYIDVRANTGSAANLFADDRFNYICVEG